MWLWPEQQRARWAACDLRVAIALQQAVAQPMLRLVLAGASRLGDGVAWYALLLVLPFTGAPHAWQCMLQMLCVGTINLVIYRHIKRRIGRQRPFVNCPDIHACARTLDQFSFPSGHTLHAVAFALLLSYHYPAFTAPLWAFAALVAVSRVVLGLHYPSDVLASVAGGLVTAGVALWAWP